MPPERFLKHPKRLVDTYWLIWDYLGNRDLQSFVVRVVYVRKNVATCILNESGRHYDTPHPRHCLGRWELKVKELVYEGHYLGTHEEFGWVKVGSCLTHRTDPGAWGGTWRISTVIGDTIHMELKPHRGTTYGKYERTGFLLKNWRCATEEEATAYTRLVPDLTVSQWIVDRTRPPPPPEPVPDEVLASVFPTTDPEPEPTPKTLSEHLAEDPFTKSD